MPFIERSLHFFDKRFLVLFLLLMSLHFYFQDIHTSVTSFSPWLIHFMSPNITVANMINLFQLGNRMTPSCVTCAATPKPSYSTACLIEVPLLPTSLRPLSCSCGHLWKSRNCKRVSNLWPNISPISYT